MRPEGIAAATRELKRAARAARHISTAENLDEAEDAWEDFLTHANRFYLKMRGACHGQGIDWKWWKSRMDERRDDPLLAYIHHARNSDTHRLEDITERVPAGPFVLHIQGVGTVNYSGPEHLRPLPVTDRGEVYQPPITHFGERLNYPHAGELATRALLYFQGVLAVAASRLR